MADRLAGDARAGWSARRSIRERHRAARADHDHFLVGPGGVVLLETKWGSRAWAMDDRDTFLQAALAQTARNAKQLAGWHEVARHGRPQVKPVLVLWGEAKARIADRPPVRHQRSGVLVMAGDDVASWALRQGRTELSPEQVADIWSSLVAHAGKRDAVEQRDKAMPRSLGDLLRIAASCLVAGFVGFLASGQLLQLVDDLWLWTAAGVLTVALLEVAGRRLRWPWQMRALQAGFLGMYLLAAVVMTRAYISA